MPLGTGYGKSAILGKPKKTDMKKVREAKRLSDFMSKRKSNRKKTMDELRDKRLKLNRMTKKDIGM